MAKTSALPVAETLADNDTLIVVQGGATKQLPRLGLAGLLAASVAAGLDARFLLSEDGALHAAGPLSMEGKILAGLLAAVADDQPIRLAEYKQTLRRLNAWHPVFRGAAVIDWTAATIAFPDFIIVRDDRDGQGGAAFVVGSAYAGGLVAPFSKLDAVARFYYLDTGKVGTGSVNPIVAIDLTTGTQPPATDLAHIYLGMSVSGIFTAAHGLRWRYVNEPASVRQQQEPFSSVLDPWDLAFYGPIVIDRVANTVTFPSMIADRNDDARSLVGPFSLPLSTANDLFHYYVDLADNAAPVKHLTTGNYPDPNRNIIPLANSLQGVFNASWGVEVQDRLPALPLLSDELFLVSDRKLPLYVDNLFLERSRQKHRAVLSSAKGGAAQPFVAESNAGLVEADPARIGAAASLLVQPTFDARFRNVTTLAARVKAVPVAGAPAPKILAIGDSIGHHQTLALVDTLLTAWGFTPNWIGTVRSASDAASADALGPLGEHRPGWSTQDMLGTAMNRLTLGGHFMPNGVIAAGQEATYLAMGNGARMGAQVFLAPIGSSGSAAPVVVVGGTSYRFDLAYYLARFGLATPDLITINLGWNDLLQNTPSQAQGGAVNVAALTEFTAGIAAIVAEARRAQPTAQILLWSTVSPNSPIGDAYTAGMWGSIRKTIVSLVKTLRTTDPKIHLCSAWNHQSADAGWDTSTGVAADGYGVAHTQLQEFVHPAGAARLQHAEALAAAIANLV